MDATPNRTGVLQTPVPTSLPHLASPRRSHTDFGYRHRSERQTDQRLKPSHGVLGPTVCFALPLPMQRALVRIPTAVLTLAVPGPAQRLRRTSQRLHAFLLLRCSTR